MQNVELENKLSKVVEKFEENLKNKETREKVVSLLDEFSKLERVDFIRRYSSISKYIDEICGENSNFVLFSILGKSTPEVKLLLQPIKDEEVRNWLSDVNAKYISLFEGCFPPFLNDWYRVLWTVKVDHTHGNMPFLETTVIKRNQETAFLDVPFANMLILINHWLTQMCTTKAFNISEDPEFMAQLRKTKQLVDNTIGVDKSPEQPNP